MIYYYGTSYEQAKKIVEDCFIKITDKEICSFESTKTGFVYISTSFIVGCDFASKPRKYSKNICDIIFKIELDSKEKIEKDVDEAEVWRSTTCYDENLPETCFKINRNLILGEDVISYWRFDYGHQDKVYELLKCNVDDNYFPMEKEWIKIKK